MQSTNPEPSDDDDDDDEKGRECCICLESKPEVGILDGCDHLFCSTCLMTWRATGRNGFTSGTFGIASDYDPTSGRACPLCRVVSGTVVYADRPPVTPADKRRILLDGLSSKVDPVLGELLQGVGVDWACLVELVCSSFQFGCAGVDRLAAYESAAGHDTTVVWIGRNHASFMAYPDARRTRSVVCLGVADCGGAQRLLVQVELGSCRREPRPDDRPGWFHGGVADEAVRWLLEKVEGESWRAVEPELNPRHGEFYLVRNFQKVSCVLHLMRVGERPTTTTTTAAAATAAAEEEGSARSPLPTGLSDLPSYNLAKASPVDGRIVWSPLPPLID